MFKHAVIVMATGALILTSGCALAPPAGPAVVSNCPAPAPAAASSAPPAAPPAPVARVAARPVYVRPVVPPLPPDLHSPSAQGAVAPKAQRRVAVPAAPPDAKS